MSPAAENGGAETFPRRSRSAPRRPRAYRCRFGAPLGTTPEGRERAYRVRLRRPLRSANRRRDNQGSLRRPAGTAHSVYRPLAPHLAWETGSEIPLQRSRSAFRVPRRRPLAAMREGGRAEGGVVVGAVCASTPEHAARGDAVHLPWVTETSAVAHRDGCCRHCCPDAQFRILLPRRRTARHDVEIRARTTQPLAFSASGRESAALRGEHRKRRDDAARLPRGHGGGKAFNLSVNSG